MTSPGPWPENGRRRTSPRRSVEPMTERITGPWTEITDGDALVALLGEPIQRVRDKVRPALLDLDRQWLAASPFCLMATAGADGRCDVSPEGRPGRRPRPRHRRPDHRDRRAAGEPAGRRLPQHPREPARRADLPDPRPHRHAADQRPGPAGPRRAVLRRDGGQGPPTAAGRGRRDRPDLPPLPEGVPPLGAVGPETWDPFGRVPRRAVLAHRLDVPEKSVEELDAYYGPSYADGLYA